MTDRLPPPLISARPRLRIGGEDQPALNEAILDCRVHLPLSGMAQLELRAVNWSGRVERGDSGFAFEHIGLGEVVEVLLGESAEAPLFSGEITAVEERYGDGAPQLVLLAEDQLHRLARVRHNRSFADLRLDDIAQRLAQEAGLGADAQLGEVQSTWHQVNESDLAFLTRLAAPYDIAVRLQDGRLRVRPEEADSAPEALDPANNVRRLRLIADLNRQPLSATVRGYSLASAEPTSAEADALTPAPRGSSAADILHDLGWAGAAIYPQPHARSQGEADAWAAAQFRHRAKRFVHGDLVCAGLPAMRSGREVELSGVSARFRGRYQVVDCEHRFDAGEGYSTRLKLQRPDWQPEGG